MIYASDPNDLEEVQEKATTLSTGYEIAEGTQKDANYLEKIEELQEQINNLSLINSLATPPLNKPYEQPAQNNYEAPRSQKVQCYKCNKFGHMARDCRNGADNRPN